MNNKFDELAKGLAQSATRRQALKRFGVALAGMALAGFVAWPACAQFSQIGPLAELSQPNPTGGCNDGVTLPGTWTINDAVEPFVAVNPAHPNNVVAAWVLGPVQNIIAGVSVNGGQTWQQVPIPLTICSGGPYLAAATERVAFAPNGDLYIIAVAANDLSIPGVFVCKSIDGGFQWSAPVGMTGNTFAPDGTPSITPDPGDPRFVYAVWDGADNGNRGTSVFSRTTDGGTTWEPARQLVQLPAQNSIQFSQILVLPNGTLVDVYEQYFSNLPKKPITQTSLQVTRSTDRGLTWSPPSLAVTMTPLYVTSGSSIGNTLVLDPETGQLLIDPTNPSFAIDRSSGNLYAVWEDGRFSSFQYNDIAFSMSSDGGLTWSAPIRVNQAPLSIPPLNRQAFLPAIGVAGNGLIGVSYYDFRFNDPAPGLPTDRWLVQCQPAPGAPASNPANWGNEVRLTDRSFNLEASIIWGGGLMLGEYFGLASSGNSFVAVFTQPDPNNGISSIFARRVGP